MRRGRKPRKPSKLLVTSKPVTSKINNNYKKCYMQNSIIWKQKYKIIIGSDNSSTLFKRR